jgi:hypothetical protein
MKMLRVIWPAALMVVAGACSKATPVGPTPPSPPWVVALVMDSLTPASHLYGSPLWAFFIARVGSNGERAFSSRGTLGRDEVGRFARCLGPALRFAPEDQINYVALGDTLYSNDSAAYWRNVDRLSQGGAPMIDLFLSLARGDSQAVLPGLAVLAAPSFQGTASANGRGATTETAVLRHWSWRDGGSAFAEDTARASLVACGLN